MLFLFSIHLKIRFLLRPTFGQYQNALFRIVRTSDCIKNRFSTTSDFRPASKITFLFRPTLGQCQNTLFAS